MPILANLLSIEELKFTLFANNLKKPRKILMNEGLEAQKALEKLAKNVDIKQEQLVSIIPNQVLHNGLC
jgi:hypothetical protein